MEHFKTNKFPGAVSADSVLVSVIIPAYNEEELLAASISRIREAFKSSRQLANAYEIIVCNNNSTDRTGDVAQRCGCKVVFEPINQISRARNRGAQIAGGQWLLFVDADSWPPPGLIGGLASLLDRGDCIGCGSTIRVVDGPWWFKFAWESKNWSMRLFKWCPGGFLLCRRNAFDELGGFALDHYIFEELEFVKRPKKLAARRGQKFSILHKHPFRTSGRKGVQHGPGSWLKTAIRLSFFFRKSVRDRAFADKWYGVKR